MTSLGDSLCVNCRKPKAETPCGVCEERICKKCRVFLAADSFELEQNLPDELKHTYYCPRCFGDVVEPYQAEYEAAAIQAKDVNIIYKGSKSAFRILRKADKPDEISKSPDRDLALLKLAFMAAKNGYNSVIEVEVDSQKVRNEGYQTSVWGARGLQAEIKSYEQDF